MVARLGFSMRWWLALVFAAIAALTALSVAEVFNSRAEHALRGKAQDLAIGQSVSAAASVTKALRRGELSDSVGLIADRRQFSLWVFAPDGKLLSGRLSRHVDFASVPQGKTALQRTLSRGRFEYTSPGGQLFVVGLRLRDGAGAVVTFTRRPELLTELGAVQNQILRAALVAVAIGAVVGLLVAMLIAARLRRIASTAAAIEAGAFDTALQPRFHDELGSLAATIDQMRLRLRDSFGNLAAERDRLRQLLEGLQEGVLAVDGGLRLAFANRAARSLLREHPLAEGEPLPESWLGFPLREFSRGLFGSTAVSQARIVTGERTFALSGIPARPGTANAILVLADVSERERRERAEREFVANAAHELGTPLTAIQASLEVLQGGAKEDEVERDRFLALIERQTSRLGRLRRALLALARAQTRHEALQLEPVPLRELLERVVEEAGANAGGVELSAEAEEGVAALAHPELLEQVVFNLVENALTHAKATRVELVGRELRRGLVVVEVRDDGEGIDGERERLFDRFYRGGDGGGTGNGFGLGLAIVREAVRAVGGTIEIDSRPGGGTTVSVSLAAAKPAAGPSGRAPASLRRDIRV